MSLFVLGISHHSAPLEVREKFAFAPDRHGEALADLARQPGVAEAVLVSTCNRTEIYCRADGEAAPRAWLEAHAARAGVDLAAHLYSHAGEAATRHVFRVAAGLDSMVLGEPQILGQVKQSVRAAQAISLAELPARIAEFDIVITGTASTLPILGKGLIERALKARRQRPMFIVDFAVPRDVEAEVATLRDVFLYTLDDLGNIVQEGAESRRGAVAEAEAIVERQVLEFRGAQGSRAAVPAIVELRRRAELYRETELARARARLARGDDPGAVLEALAKGLANKFLHHPSQALSRAGDGERAALTRAIEALYPELDEREPPLEP